MRNLTAAAVLQSSSKWALVHFITGTGVVFPATRKEEVAEDVFFFLPLALLVLHTLPSCYLAAIEAGARSCSFTVISVCCQHRSLHKIHCLYILVYGSIYIVKLAKTHVMRLLSNDDDDDDV